MPTNKKKKKRREREEGKEAGKWAAKFGSTESQVHSKGLSKTLPHTAEGLRDGSIDPKVVAASVVRMRHQEQIRQGEFPETRFALKKNPSLRLTLSEAHDMTLQNAVVGGFSCDDEAYSFYTQLIEENNRLLEANLSSMVQDIQMMDMEERGRKGFVSTQASYDQVVNQWILDGKLPDQRDNPFYNIPLEDFCSLLLQQSTQMLDMSVQGVTDLIQKSEENDLLYTKVLAAAEGVVQGKDLIKRTCWTCNKVAKGGSHWSGCKKCHVAVYCGRECQRTAWYAGHKAGCSLLGNKYKQYKADQNRVDQAAKDNRVVTGGININSEYDTQCFLKPVLVYDYSLAYMLAVMPPLQLEFTIEPPTLDTFYTHIATLVCGGTHPLFRDVHGAHSTKRFLHMKTFDLEELVGMQPLEEAELMSVIKTNSVLGYNLSNTSEAEVENFVEIAHNHIRASGPLLTVERYIEIYGFQGNVEMLGLTGAEQRYETDRKVFEYWKNNF